MLGIVELDPLESIDKPSVTVGYALYGTFLIMGVILLINMMIALLSNTYTRVEVRYFAFSPSLLLNMKLLPVSQSDKGVILFVSLVVYFLSLLDHVFLFKTRISLANDINRIDNNIKNHNSNLTKANQISIH